MQKVTFNSHEKSSYPKFVIVYQVGQAIFEVVSIEVLFNIQLQIMIPLITNIHIAEVVLICSCQFNHHE